MSAVEGTCNCGAIKVSVATDKFPSNCAICHCLNCSTSGGSNYSVNLVIPTAEVHISGTPKQYYDTDTVAKPVIRNFCGDCGTPVMSVKEEEPDTAFVKGGLFKKTGVKVPPPFAEVWTSKRESWEVPLEGVFQRET